MQDWELAEQYTYTSKRGHGPLRYYLVHRHKDGPFTRWVRCGWKDQAWTCLRCNETAPPELQDVALLAGAHDAWIRG